MGTEAIGGDGQSEPQAGERSVTPTARVEWELADRIFAGTGEMSALSRSLDWSETPLGPAEKWPPSLRTVAGLVLSSPMAMVVLWGPDLVQIYNDGYRVVMGDKHPAGLGAPTRECWPEVWAFNAPIYERVVRGESVTLTDQPLTILRGNEPEEAFFTLTYSGVPDDDGSIGGVLVTVVETTEVVRRRADRERERALLLAGSEEARAAAMRAAEAAVESEARYRALFESMDEGFCVLEMIFDENDRPVDYRFIEGNAAFEEQTGLLDPIGHTARELVPELEEHWFEIYGRVALTGEPIRFQNGSEQMGRWFDVYAFRFGDPARRRIALLFTDITEARAAERERDRLLEAERVARAEAEAASRAKGEFLAIMSHEFRTPLNAISGYAELLELGIHGPVNTPQRNAIERIQASQQHLLGLINEVLNYAKLESGRVPYEVGPVPVREVLASVAGLVDLQAVAGELELHIGECPPHIIALADDEKLRQIIVNLLSNAIKFTDPGGQVAVSCEQSGDEVHISVRDSGIGIPPDKLETIFEPFVQVRAEYTRTAKGTGLGLAISRDLARGMHGDLQVESRLGEGSTFRIILPTASDRHTS